MLHYEMYRSDFFFFLSNFILSTLESSLTLAKIRSASETEATNYSNVWHRNGCHVCMHRRGSNNSHWPKCLKDAMSLKQNTIKHILWIFNAS